MAVGLKAPDSLAPVAGVRIGSAEAGVRRPNRLDLALIEIAESARVAAVFTRNAFCAAPVVVARRHLAAGVPVRALLVNSGNANAGTGAGGLEDARATADRVAALLGCRPEAVLPFSTGVIGERLPVERISAAVPKALADLAEDGWMRGMQAIMTTDSVPKGISRQLEISGRKITITGIAKGAGMIRPDMATMLAFVACDAVVSQPALAECLRHAVDRSFNCITVDGDTSTNDACVLIATGKAGNPELDPGHPDFLHFCEAVESVCAYLAQAIVRDGEGATHFISVEVEQAASAGEARRVAETVAHSPLVKTACFAGDPNWGRILAAVGRSGIENLEVGRVQILLNDVQVVRDGGLDPAYREAAGAAVMKLDAYRIIIRLGRGTANTRLWTCDLGHEYVRINAEYRS
jgi:glutamate N-acetyltransferase/amino-acid N-acetyltransferase